MYMRCRYVMMYPLGVGFNIIARISEENSVLVHRFKIKTGENLKTYTARKNFLLRTEGEEAMDRKIRK